MHYKLNLRLSAQTLTLVALAIAGLLLITGCESSSSGGDSTDFGDRDPSQVAVLGDSIGAGYGDAGTPWPDRLAGMLDRAVYNYSVPGASSHDALSRLGTVLGRGTGFVIISIGANDAIKGYGAETVKDNLAAMIAEVRAAQAYPVVGNVIGMTDGHVIYNGEAEKVNRAIKDLCSAEGVLLVDLYSEVSLSLLQSDGLHPDSDGQEVIARAFYNKL